MNPNDPSSFLDYMKIKAVLTDKALPQIDDALLENYFTDLWTCVYSKIDNYIKVNVIKLGGKQAEVWDILRFALKGSTSILKALKFFNDIGEDDRKIAANFAEVFKKSDWDSLLFLNRQLPQERYYYVYFLFVECVYDVNSRYIPEFNKYIQHNLSKFQFNLSREDIEKIVIGALPSDVKIISVSAIPSFNNTQNSLRDYVRDSSYQQKPYYEHYENEFSKYVLGKINQNNRNMKVEQMTDPTHYDNGLFLGIWHEGVNNSCVYTSYIRDIRSKNRDKTQYHLNFDLIRLLINFKMTVTFVHNHNTRQFSYNYPSELIDISVDFDSHQFDKLPKSKILPVYNMPHDEYKGIKTKMTYPMVDIDYNLQDLIEVFNEGSTPEKNPKRCSRIRKLMSIKCQSEKVINLPTLNPNNIPECQRLPSQLNEQTCRQMLGVPWGSNISREKTKEELINGINGYIGTPKDILWNIKKDYLYHITKRFKTWFTRYPEITELIKQLARQIFAIISRELVIHPRLINPYLQLPQNLLDVLFMRNVLIDESFRQYMIEIRYKCDTTIVKAISDVESFFKGNALYSPPFLVGGMAYQHLYNNFSRLYPQENFGLPIISPDYDVSMVTSNNDVSSIEPVIIGYFQNVRLTQQDVASLNINPDFEVVNIKSLNEDELRENWAWKYLSNLNAPEEKLLGINNDYTFITTENLPERLTVRVNIITRDKRYDIYRTDHIVEFSLFKNLSSSVELSREGIHGLNVINYRELFNNNFLALNNRQRSGNIKWVLDYDRLLFLCNLNRVLANRGNPFLAAEQIAECQKLVTQKAQKDAAITRNRQLIVDFLASMK